MNLLVLGTVAYDSIETPLGKVDRILGGSGTYIALSASYLNPNPKIISIIGEDFKNSDLELIGSHQIDTKSIELIKGNKTFYWSGKYHNNMNDRDTIETQLNVLEIFNPKLDESSKNTDYLMLGNLHPIIQNSVLKQINKKPKLTVLDTMNFWMDTALDDLKAVIQKIDVLTINDEEARQLSSEYSLIKAAKAILNMGPKYLIIKKGEHGALLFNNNLDTFFAPALPIKDVFDPTGAGDSFAGGFIGYLAKTNDTSFENMKKALIYGSAMASFCVEKFGTEKLLHLTQKQIQDRLNKFVKLSHFTL